MKSVAVFLLNPMQRHSSFINASTSAVFPDPGGPDKINSVGNTPDASNLSRIPVKVLMTYNEQKAISLNIQYNSTYDDVYTPKSTDNAIV